MSNKTKAIFIIFAGVILVAIGVFASILLIQRFTTDEEGTAVEVDIIKTSVVVVTRDMFLGDKITEGDVELAKVPIEVAPRNALSTLEEAYGRIIKTDLVQGEMVLSHNLADPTNTNKDLSYILSEDHVLFAFPAEDLMSRESIVQRGDIVDIFATFIEEIPAAGEISEGSDKPEEPITKTFTVDTLPKISVTALVMDIIAEESSSGLIEGQTDQGGPSRITKTKAYLLALNPQDALILKHLKDIGAIFDLVLRSPTSTLEFNLTPVTEEYIIEYYGLEILP